MVQQMFPVAAICMAFAIMQVGTVRAENGVRVYPTPKRLEMTGGVSSAKLNDAKVRKAKGLGEEGYRIVVGKETITIEASTKAGGFYALQTLRQLASGGAVPCCTVETDCPLARCGRRVLRPSVGHRRQA